MDFVHATLFWLWYEVLSLPLRGALSRCSAPAGVRRMLSRVAGPPLLLLPLWVAGHWTALPLLVPVGWLWWLGLLAVAASALRPPRRVSLLGWLGYPTERQRRRRSLLLDGAGLALMLAFVAFRRWVPEMPPPSIDGSGAEKFANLMFFWSAWHAIILPPQDFWMAGEPLNYYYWGHFHWAWVARIGGFPADLALNLSLARLTVLVWEGGWLLARAVGLGSLGAAVAGLLATWGGNPAAVREAWRAWQGSTEGFPWGGYPYWNPSRAIPNVVDEFPAFTAILGDFHAHHLALPWLLGWLALTVGGARWWQATGSLRGGGVAGGGAVWIGLGTVAVLANLWNLPLIALALGMSAVVAFASRTSGRPQLERRELRALLALGVVFGLTLALTLRLGGPGVPLTERSTETVRRLPVRVLGSALRSPPSDLLSFWGFPVAAIGLAAAAGLVGPRGPAEEDSRSRRGSRLFAFAGFSLVGLAASVPAALPGGVAWLWVGVGCWIASLALDRHPWLSAPAAALLVGSCALLAGLEMAYIDDRFEGELVRYNTYFKFSFPVWTTMSVGAVAAGAAMWRRAAPRALLWAGRASLVGLVAAAAVYPVCALPARLAQSRWGDAAPREPNLSAVVWLANETGFAAEASVLDWMRSNVPGGEVVAEAGGAQVYTFAGRAASLGARPIVLGWEHHEHQWRGAGSYGPVAERTAALDSLYRAPSPQAARDQASSLGVRWVLFGQVEEGRYGREPLAVLRQTAPVAASFPEGDPTVFLFDFRGIVAEGDR